MLTAQAFLLHLAACAIAQGAPPDRLQAVAVHESGLDPWAMHDNTTGRSIAPASLDEAVTLARGLVAAGHSIDAGVMQVNVSNWRRFGLTVASVFDPAVNICAGAQILADAYQIERRALCRYNTGRPDCTNGYPEAVSRVEAAFVAPAPVAALPVDSACGPAPPSWDGWAMEGHVSCVARHEQQQETEKK